MEKFACAKCGKEIEEGKIIDGTPRSDIIVCDECHDEYLAYHRDQQEGGYCVQKSP